MNMVRFLVLAAAALMGVFASLTAAASATAVMGYQPRLPKSLR